MSAAQRLREVDDRLVPVLAARLRRLLPYPAAMQLAPAAPAPAVPAPAVPVPAAPVPEDPVPEDPVPRDGAAAPYGGPLAAVRARPWLTALLAALVAATGVALRGGVPT